MKILLQILCKLSYRRKSDANKGEEFFFHHLDINSIADETVKKEILEN